MLAFACRDGAARYGSGQQKDGVNLRLRKKKRLFHTTNQRGGRTNQDPVQPDAATTRTRNICRRALIVCGDPMFLDHSDSLVRQESS